MSHVPPADAHIGRTLGGQYRIEALLGEGGMGRVYRGVQLSVQRAVAIKLITGSLPHPPEWLERFRREAEATARLSHPNSVRLYDFGVTEAEELYMVMELLEGTDLARKLREGGRLPLAAALDITRQVLSALSEAHALGVVHRDIKPENVFLASMRGGETLAKLMDFGIADIERASARSRLTGAGVVIGTPAYMSPEQAQGHPVDARSDLYSVGIVLFEMLSGRQPYASETPLSQLIAHVTQPPQRLSDVGVQIPEQAAIQALLDGLLAKAPDQRPTVGAALSAVAMLSGSGTGSTWRGVGERPATGSARRASGESERPATVEARRARRESEQDAPGQSRRASGESARPATGSARRTDGESERAKARNKSRATGDLERYPTDSVWRMHGAGTQVPRDDDERSVTGDSRRPTGERGGQRSGAVIIARDDAPQRRWWRREAADTSTPPATESPLRGTIGDPTTVHARHGSRILLAASGVVLTAAVALALQWAPALRSATEQVQAAIAAPADNTSQPAAAPYRVTITSTPSGASVVLHDLALDVTPCTLEFTESADVGLSLYGYERRVLHVAPGGKAKLHVELVRERDANDRAPELSARAARASATPSGGDAKSAATAAESQLSAATSRPPLPAHSANTPTSSEAHSRNPAGATDDATARDARDPTSRGSRDVASRDYALHGNSDPTSHDSAARDARDPASRDYAARDSASRGRAPVRAPVDPPKSAGWLGPPAAPLPKPAWVAEPEASPLGDDSDPPDWMIKPCPVGRTVVTALADLLLTTPERARQVQLMRDPPPYPNILLARRAYDDRVIDRARFEESIWVLREIRRERTAAEKEKLARGIITQREYDERYTRIVVDFWGPFRR